MEKKSKEKNEIFLPRALMDDIDFDELDKELQFTSISEGTSATNQSNYLLFYFIVFIYF
jgi:hypothetical protein